MKNWALAVLILAAGTSTRMGSQTKQLLQYNNISLLELAVQKALAISQSVYVVLGHEKQKCQSQILNYPIQIIYNPDYKQGIGSSISTGIQHTQKYSHTLIMLADQPFIPISHYKKLIEQTKEDIIIASYYQNSIGVPALFCKTYYPKLLQLKGEKGAKSILNDYCTIKVELIEEYAIDIDTKEDVTKYL